MKSHQPRRRFGQNFLRDQNVIAQIVEAVSPAADDHIVEIGPGQGAITYPLQPRCELLDLVELDRDLAQRLSEKFASMSNVRVHSADALRFDFSTLGPRTACRVVGNLPYNISTPLIFHLLEQAPLFNDLHFLLQREVVDRMVAEPGTRSYGRLSVMVQYACTAERLFTVPPGAFYPVPKVQSALVRLAPHREPIIEVTEVARFRRIVTQAFSQRRKTLRNSLQGVVAPTAMEGCGIDPKRRPETLSLVEFAALANAPIP